MIERFVVPGSLGATYPNIASERTAHSAYVAWTARVGDRRELRLARWVLRR